MTALAPTGEFIYQDPYGQLHVVSWTTSGNLLDLTVTVQQPHVWGEPDRIQWREGVLYRRGIITVQRFVYRQGETEPVGGGVSQFVDFFRVGGGCDRRPTDPFRYHLDQALSDEWQTETTAGPRWADPAAEADIDVNWGEVAEDGSVSGTGQLLEFVDVWTA